MDELVKEFLVEAHELVDKVDSDLVRLEGEPTNQALLAAVFRALHTIKGTCGFLSFHQLESLSHRAENLLAHLRDGKAQLSAEMTTALLHSMDSVRAILKNIEETGKEGDVDVVVLVETLDRLQRESVAPKPTKHEDDDDEDFSSAKKKNPTLGEILVEGGKARQTDVTRAIVAQAKGDPRRLGEILVEQGTVAPKDILDAVNRQDESRKSLTDSHIRVDVRQLDRLMNLVGELVLARNQIQQFTKEYQETSFINTAQRLSLITSELQEGVMKTRMQAVGSLWKKFPRVVRQLSLVCGKRVRVEMEGQDTELDSAIIEAIKDPLTHVIRNSVDHGIENSEGRAAAGKPDEGCILLRAYHEGGQVNMEITDDGGGIDPERCRAKAVERGILTPIQASSLPKKEAMELIFRPGFSTAAQVTSVSGRGVGMDVVKTNIEKIGGTVEIDSKLGVGTTLRVKIPLTLAIIPALIVTSDGRPFAIPQVNLLELVRLESDSARQGVEVIQGAPVFRLRGNLLPLVYLADVLEYPRRAGLEDSVHIVVLQAEQRSFGLIVEEVLDTAEIVVKPLAKQIKRVHSFAGATILGDGTVALILDVLGVAYRANLIREIDRMSERSRKKDSASIIVAQRYLLFRLGDKRRMALPLSMVARLEDIPYTRLEKAGELTVVQYRGKVLPVIDLAEQLGVEPSEVRKNSSTARILVFEEGACHVGIQVDSIIDIVEDGTAVDRSFAARGVIGSAVLQGYVTEILDVESILSELPIESISRDVISMAA